MTTTPFMRLAASIAAIATLASCAHTPRDSAGMATIATPADTAGAADVAWAWWRAITFGDTAYLELHTAPRLTLTLSNGQGSWDRATLLRESATHHPKASAFTRPATDVRVSTVAGAAVVTMSVSEGSQGGANEFHYLTLLERQGAEWRVAAAQSTRRLALTPRVPARVAGALSAFAGEYQAPRGGVLRIVTRDSALALVDPGGAESRLEPIGPSLFELPALYDGIAVVRFAFARDSSGNVTSLSRLIYGSVTTFPRVR